jgi:hypothetical protein
MTHLRSSVAAAFLATLSAGLLSPACSSDEASPEPSPSTGGSGASTGGASTGGTGGGAAPTGGSGNATSTGGTGGGAAPSTDEVVGNFRITIKEPTASRDGFTEVIGFVYERPYPEELVWEETHSAGDCQLLEPNVPFCDPACTGGDVCVEGGVCVDPPTKKALGEVTVRGVRTAGGATEFTMKAVAGNYQPGSDTGTLPYAAFEPGDPLSVSTTGGDFAPINLESTGIAPLVVTTEAPVPVESEKAVSLAWEAGANPASKIEIKLEISHHGGVKGMVTCVVPDTGSTEIPALLVTELIALGVAGYPTVSLTRVTRDQASISAGVVELLVMSQSALAVQIPGLVSCSETEPCPDGQECTAARKCD